MLEHVAIDAEIGPVVLGLLVLLAEEDHTVAEAAQLLQAVEGDGRRVLPVDHYLEHVNQAVVARHRGGLYLNQFVW